MKRKTFFILTGCAVVAFLFRIYLLPTHLFFGPEQGKDFLVIRDIVINHKLTLIGPKTDVSGVFHGPIYYYLATIPFAISFGNPLWVAYTMAFLQALTVFPLFLLGKQLTHRNRTGYLSVILFTCSYGAIVYSRWLSGQPLTFPLIALFYLGILRFLQGKDWYLILSAISFGLCGQAEFMNFFLLTIVGGGIVLWNYKKFFGKSLPIVLVSLGVALIVSLGNFVVFDVRHDFLITKAAIGLLLGHQEQAQTLIRAGSNVIAMFFVVIHDLIGSQFMTLTKIVIGISFVVMWFFRKEKQIHSMLLGIILPLLALILLRREVLEQLYLPVLLPFLVWIAFLLDTLWVSFRKTGILLLFLFVCMNAYTVLTNLPSNTRVFFQAPQPSVRYSDQLSVIQTIYAHANGKPFGIQSYTIPYFWQDGWTYLFWWKGTTVYHYLPDEKDDKQLYVIIQKDRINPQFQKDWREKTVSQWGTLTYTFTKGDYTIEERIKE